MKQTTLTNSWCVSKSQTASSSTTAENPVIIEDDEEDEAFLLEAMDAASKIQDAPQSSKRTDSSAPEEDPRLPDPKALKKRLKPLRCVYRPTVNDSVHIEGFDLETGMNWVYPTNMSVRDYQLNIVQESLFKNTLVCLPTGLGKTFIAAVVMFNFYRWYPNSKIVFMAPTRPLVTQQMDACFNIMGISQDSTIEMTGTLMPNVRRREWNNRRLIFLTPQVLVNDVQSNACPVNLIKCVVIDEAHKASGNHAYCQVIREISAKSSQFRVLALTATPGSDIKSVQDVIHNLLISHIELRTEECQDIKMYSFERTVEKVIVPLGHELSEVKDLYYRLLDVLVQKLRYLRALGSRNTVGSLSKFALVKQQEVLKKSGFVGINQLNVSAIYKNFGLAISLYHGYELLQQHGLRPLFSYLDGILKGERSHASARVELRKMPEFMAVWECLEKRYRADPNASLSEVLSTQREYVSGHPKLDKLREIVLEHFESRRNSTHNSSIIIFSQFRDSVAEILHMLKKQGPLVKPVSFIGQNSGKSSKGKGYSQKDQLRVMKEFRDGVHNVLISTCVGEEGLDIGEVDLIICFDSAASPVRLIQRMGRTGRKRTGRIVMLLTEGKEVNSYNTSLSKKRNIHKAIFDGVRQLQFYPNNPRMIPLDLKPEVDFKRMDIVKKATPAGKKRKNDKDKENRGQKSIKSMLKKQSPHKMFLSTQVRQCFQESRSSVKSCIGGVDLERTPLLTLLKGEDQENVSSTLSSQSNKFLRCNQRLQDSCMIGHGSLTRDTVAVLRLLKDSRRGRTSLVFHALGFREVTVEEPGDILSRSELDFSSGEEDFAVSKLRRRSSTEAPLQVVILKDSEDEEDEVATGSCSPVFGGCTQTATAESVDEFDEDLTREEFYSKSLRHVMPPPSLDVLDELVEELKSSTEILSGPALTIADLNALMFPGFNLWGFNDIGDNFSDKSKEEMEVDTRQSPVPEDPSPSIIRRKSLAITESVSAALESRNESLLTAMKPPAWKKNEEVSSVPRASRRSSLLSCFQTSSSGKKIQQHTVSSSRVTMTQAMAMLDASSFNFDLSISGFDCNMSKLSNSRRDTTGNFDLVSNFGLDVAVNQPKKTSVTECNFDLGFDFNSDTASRKEKSQPKNQCNFDLGFDFDSDTASKREKSQPKNQRNFDLNVQQTEIEANPQPEQNSDFNWLLDSFDSPTMRTSSPKRKSFDAEKEKNPLIENFRRSSSVARSSPFKLDLLDDKGIAYKAGNSIPAPHQKGASSSRPSLEHRKSFQEDESSFFVGRPKKHRAFIVESEDSDNEFESPPWLTKRSVGTFSVKAVPCTSKKTVISDDADSPFPKKKKKKTKKRSDEAARAFIFSQASVEDEESGGDSESEDVDEYDSSFVDDADASADNHEKSAMVAVYAASLRNRRGAHCRGQFKLQYEPVVEDRGMIFSQEPEQDDSYERDSFCVSEADTPERQVVRRKKNQKKRRHDDEDAGVCKKVKRMRLVEEEITLSDSSDFK